MNCKLLAALARSDLRNSLRDPMLQVTYVVPFLLFGLLRFALPVAAEIIHDRFGFDLTGSYPLIISVAVLLVPMMTGMVMAFIMLDELDDHVFSALAVTPLGLGGYMAGKIILPILISTLMVWLLLMFNGLMWVSPVSLFFAAAVSSLIGPVIALCISGYAENKITGLTLSKASGILMIMPVLYHLSDSSWAAITLIIPTVPSALMMQRLLTGSRQWYWLLVISLVHQGLLMAGALRYFSRRRCQ